MNMPESCFGQCIMEPRIKGLEDNYAKQAEQYRKDSIDNAIKSTEMQKDIKSILKIQEEMNKSLNKVLDENQKQKVEKAASKNEEQASKWKSLSSGTKVVIITAITTGVTLLVSYLFSLATK